MYEINCFSTVNPNQGMLTNSQCYRKAHFQQPILILTLVYPAAGTMFEGGLTQIRGLQCIKQDIRVFSLCNRQFIEFSEFLLDVCWIINIYSFETICIRPINVLFLQHFPHKFVVSNTYPRLNNLTIRVKHISVLHFHYICSK